MGRFRPWVLIVGCLLVALAGRPGPVAGQARELQTHEPGSPEAKLMLYYSSAVAFSPLGVTLGAGTPNVGSGRPGGGAHRLEAAVELAYLPPLSAAQRTVGSDKPEATNLAPVFARPRVGVRLPAGVALELSWIPPVRLFDVKANLFAGALSRAVPLPAGMSVVPRVAVLAGRVEGPITCNRDTSRDGGPALATYFAFVCHGNDSRDFFEPRHLSGELLVTRTSPVSQWHPYVSAGARAEHTRFDIGVIRADGTRDPDQPVLEVNTTSVYGTAGVSWTGVRRTRLAAELYYAPGSVLTVRALAGVRLW